jgi:ATP-binding cassette subfamily F protein uup
MNYISVENTSKILSDKVLFSNLTFGLSKGEKVAFIARNGAGKSSLLRILAAKDAGDSGKVVLRNGVRVGYLEQHPEFNQPVSILDYIANSHSEVFNILREYQKALADQSLAYNDETHAAFELATRKMDQFHAWDYERKLKELLNQFKIVDLSQFINTLSGGQKKRLALALVLLDEPDLFLLDEPTNHLDIDMIEWLEKRLAQSNVTLLIVTHDRYFLDSVCNRIIELDQGKLFQYKGSYEYFLEKKAERVIIEKTETDKARQLMKKELEWLRRMPKARTTKSKARIDAFQDISEKAAGNKQQKNLNLEIKMSRVGGKILELEKVTKQFGDKIILNKFDYIFKKGERIGIIGANGTGKSTFLNILSGKEKQFSGNVLKGETTVFGYYTQEGLKLDEDKRVIDVVKDIAEYIPTANGSVIPVSQYLYHFQFSNEMQYTRIAKLSGGEKRRLHLLTVLVRNPNFLILDEPTNDLDIDTLNILEEFLSEYSGCLILVSHDRYFLDRLADHLFIFEGDGIIKDFYGSYTAYKLNLNTRQKSDNKTKEMARTTTRESANKPIEKEKSKLSYKEKLELHSLEREIEQLEIEKSELEAEMGSGEINYEELGKKANRIMKIIESTNKKTERWLYLAAFENNK